MAAQSLAGVGLTWRAPSHWHTLGPPVAVLLTCACGVIEVMAERPRGDKATFMFDDVLRGW